MTDEPRAGAIACDFDHPHPDHPCGRQVIAGVTTCPHCGHLDESSDCKCWEPMTVGDLLIDNLTQEEEPQWTIQ